MELYEDLERRRNELERHRENSGRLAVVHATYTTTGQGSIEFGTKVDFGMTYIEQPAMAYGSYCDTDELAELLAVDEATDTALPLPLCSGVVTDWDRDDNDYWIGAWVGVRVYFPADSEISVPAATAVELSHFFTFSGVALKNVPTDGGD